MVKFNKDGSSVEVSKLLNSRRQVENIGQILFLLQYFNNEKCVSKYK